MVAVDDPEVPRTTAMLKKWTSDVHFGSKSGVSGAELRLHCSTSDLAEAPNPLPFHT